MVPARALLEKQYPNFRVSTVQPFCSATLEGELGDHMLHAEAVARKHGSCLLHILLVSGSKGPFSAPAPHFHVREAGEIAFTFL